MQAPVRKSVVKQDVMTCSGWSDAALTRRVRNSWWEQVNNKSTAAGCTPVRYPDLEGFSQWVREHVEDGGRSNVINRAAFKADTAGCPRWQPPQHSVDWKIVLVINSPTLDFSVHLRSCSGM